MSETQFNAASERLELSRDGVPSRAVSEARCGHVRRDRESVTETEHHHEPWIAALSKLNLADG